MIGKRKRGTSAVSRPTTTDEASPPPANNAQDVFRKYFEAQFEPLGLTAAQSADEEDSVEEDDEDDLENTEPESEWEGLEDAGDDDNQVEVVEYKDARLDAEDMMDKKARKAFMVRTARILSVETCANVRFSSRTRNHHLLSPHRLPRVPKPKMTTKARTKPPTSRT